MTNNGSVSFDRVLDDEEKFIRMRRLSAEQELPSANAMQSPANKLGLSLSGGGIRSASFNLGVLQALAQQKLISNLDYLSTVSGGGYIGSWLMQWIKNDGSVSNVEKLIVPNREVNATAARIALDQPTVTRTNTRRKRPSDSSDTPSEQVESGLAKIFASEPEPIRHLRANTNFLTPTPGILSVDSWTLIAIYLRNLVLNSFVLLPTLIAIKLIVVLLSLWYDKSKVESSVWSLILGCVFLAGMFACLFYTIDCVRKHVEKKIATDNFFTRSFILPLVFLVIACFFFAMHENGPSNVISETFEKVLSWFPTDEKRSDGQWSWKYCFVFSVFAGLLHTIPNYMSYWQLLTREMKVKRRGKLRWAPAIWIFSGFSAGFLFVFLILASFHLVQPISSKFVEWFQVGSTDSTYDWINTESAVKLALIVPMLLTALFVAESVQLGILGRLEYREVREKWSYFNSYCFLAAIAWFSAFLHVCIIPAWIIHSSGSWFSKFTPGVLWFVVSSISLWLAKGPLTGGAKKPYLDWLVKAAPPIFLSGATVIVATCLQLSVDLDLWTVSLTIVAMATVALVASLFVDINVFSLQELYQDRLVRTFLGASRLQKGQTGAPFRSNTIPKLRQPDPITGIDPRDDEELRRLVWAPDPERETSPDAETSHDERRTLGPLLLINTAINLGGEKDFEHQERMADSFTLSPLYCGCPRTDYRSTQDGYGDNITLGTAFAISGAAVSPNMGYYSSPAVTALLTFFNLRLGAWMPNPSGTMWKAAGPTNGWLHLFREMLGQTSSQSPYVYLSDGGHFDNLGAYELIRRRCKFIIASDAGADPAGACHELAMNVRKASIDFGVTIDIDLSRLVIDPVTGVSKGRVAVGEIHYPPLNLGDAEEKGYLIYLKMTMDGTEPPDLQSYKIRHSQFPHESTIDQFFSESQFESYRHLGYIVASQFFMRDQSEYPAGHFMCPPETTRNSVGVQRYLEYLMAIESMSSSAEWDERCPEFNDRYLKLQSQLLSDASLRKLQIEIESLTQFLDTRETVVFGMSPVQADLDICKSQFQMDFGTPRSEEEERSEKGWTIQAITLMDDVLETLQLREYHSELSRGWMRVVRRWMLTSAFDRVWPLIRGDFTLRLGRFVTELKSDSNWTVGH